MALRQLGVRLGCRSQQLLLRDLNAPIISIGHTIQDFRAAIFNVPAPEDSSGQFHDLQMGLRGFRTGSALLKDIEVEIQAMGESITEGTIAEVLKQEGESVAEDETIAQIETDKVTIDVKAPSAGKIKAIKVPSYLHS